MLEVTCTYPDAKSYYHIEQFLLLTEEDIERYRQHLMCPVCQGKAYFRKQSVNGRSACFGSNYHANDCGNWHPTLKTQQQKEVEVLNQQLAESDELIFDFVIPAKPKKENEHRRDGLKEKQSQERLSYSTQEPTEQFIDKDNTKKSANRRPEVLTPDKMLNNLLHGGELAKSETRIVLKLGNKDYPYKAKNLLVNFADAYPAKNFEEAKLKMYWGTISHTDKDFEWLNPADCDDVGIPLGKAKEGIINQYGIASRDELEGAGILFLGLCFWNKEQTRKIIKLRSADNIYISLITDE